MKHLLTTTVAFMLMTAATTAQAETAKERKARCEAQGEIVTKAVALRLKRTNETKAKEDIRAIIHVVGIYCGVPQGLECFRVARRVLEEHDML